MMVIRADSNLLQSVAASIHVGCKTVRLPQDGLAGLLKIGLCFWDDCCHCSLQVADLQRSLIGGVDHARKACTRGLGGVAQRNGTLNKVGRRTPRGGTDEDAITTHERNTVACDEVDVFIGVHGALGQRTWARISPVHGLERVCLQHARGVRHSMAVHAQCHLALATPYLSRAVGAFAATRSLPRGSRCHRDEVVCHRSGHSVGRLEAAHGALHCLRCLASCTFTRQARCAERVHAWQDLRVRYHRW